MENRSRSKAGPGGELRGWLVALYPTFNSAGTARKYERAVLAALSRRFLWSEYALSYDRVLTRTKVYPELIDTMLGYVGPLTPIAERAVVLDLGAGTGNVSLALARRGLRTIVAMENNPTMLRVLRHKCKDYLREDASVPGVLPVRQDASSLSNIVEETFDVVIANNVLYSLENPRGCLREIYRVLKPGGEVRISGPKRDTNLNKLFRQIRRDLGDTFEEVKQEYERSA